jgi:hypothetical protein
LTPVASIAADEFDKGLHCMVVIEATSPAAPGVTYPRPIEGVRHGPPENVRGPWGYLEFLEAIADPKHERHKSS